jgi:carboxypeptidase T
MGFYVKIPLVVFVIGVAGLLIAPAIQGATASSLSAHDLLLGSVRESRLRDLKNGVPAVQTTGLYHTYDEMTAILFNLAANNSDIMAVTSIGKTYEGRDLWMVKLSDNVNVQEDEPEVLFMGAHHGNEKPGYEVCLYFIRYMIENYHNMSINGIREAINNTQIYILPMVNPDGVEAGTRKNLEPNHGYFGFNKAVTSIGVDLNRNYNYKWFLLCLLPRLYLGSTSYVDSSDVYRGEKPFSENETQAIQRFVDAHNITIAISYHTFGEEILYPWGYTSRPPKNKDRFISIGENISSFDHYTVAQSIGLYPTLGDACDWMYGTHGILAFTIELGRSYAPTNPAELNEICRVHAIVNLYVCLRADSK